jgi:hypothetical protein
VAAGTWTVLAGAPDAVEISVEPPSSDDVNAARELPMGSTAARLVEAVAIWVTVLKAVDVAPSAFSVTVVVAEAAARETSMECTGSEEEELVVVTDPPSSSRTVFAFAKTELMNERRPGPSNGSAIGPSIEMVVLAAGSSLGTVMKMSGVAAARSMSVMVVGSPVR